MRQPQCCPHRGERGDAIAGTELTDHRRFAFTTRPHAAIDDATREIGAAIGVAITGSVLAAAYGHGIDPVAPMIPEPARAAVQDSLAAAIQVAEHAGPQGEQLAELAQNAFLDGLQQASWAVAAILLVGALISAFWPPRRS
ncbi:MFS transporter [Rhodococcus pyridinivorans]|uniref:MFS transporter n=1 Tax=Rhodococcus pyridinivorans TaxID=103816 RepID=UPI00200A3EAD|nr:MFS transporter [Rhodococcus pyridinivorans]UPW06261.1 MFS transporter [Rhodococcus pyridinivorans]